MMVKVAVPEKFKLRIVPNVRTILFGGQQEIHYIGGSEVLPPPLENEKECEVVRWALRRKFKDERFIKLIEIAVLSYDSGTELVDVLENEVERKKRCSDWSIYKPTYREFCGKPA